MDKATELSIHPLMGTRRHDRPVSCKLRNELVLCSKCLMQSILCAIECQWECFAGTLLEPGSLHYDACATPRPTALESKTIAASLRAQVEPHVMIAAQQFQVSSDCRH